MAPSLVVRADQFFGVRFVQPDHWATFPLLLTPRRDGKRVQIALLLLWKMSLNHLS